MIGEITIGEHKLVFNTYAMEIICNDLDCLPEEVLMDKMKFSKILSIFRGGLSGPDYTEKTPEEAGKIIDSLGGINAIDWNDVIDTFSKSVYTEVLYEKAKEIMSGGDKKKSPSKKSKPSPSVS